MNFRRRRPRKQPQCCMCTQHHWKGNAADRFRAKEREPVRAHRKRKGKMTLNQEIRSLEQSLVHDVARQARWGPIPDNDFMKRWHDEEKARIVKKQTHLAELRLQREALRRGGGKAAVA